MDVPESQRPWPPSAAASTPRASATGGSPKREFSDDEDEELSVGGPLVNGIREGRWTKEEHTAFLLGHEKFGKSWKDIATVVKTRTPEQIRTHAQKYFQKKSLGR